MALGDPYVSLADQKMYMNIKKSEDDDIIQSAINSATKQINKYCGRDFNRAGAVSARIFRPGADMRLLSVDDIASPVGLIVQTDPTGVGPTFSITWQAADYELLPLNGIVDGEPWPYYDIHAVGGLWFPSIQWRRYGTAQVTAEWGWPIVPDPIVMATKILSFQNYKMKDAPLGVAGFSQFSGDIKVRQLPMVEDMIKKYSKDGGGRLLVA